MTIDGPKHPTKFSAPLLPLMRQWLEGYDPILDPMAGVGTLRFPGLIYSELEPEWARQAPGPTLVADAGRLPFRTGTFGGVVTSPTYGNRMADHHDARDGSRRTTYKHTLGRDLTPQNTGQMQWGPAYRAAHTVIWREVHRVLRTGGVFVLNISDHIRKGEVVPVTEWHRESLEFIGFELELQHRVRTDRLRYGDNAELRVDFETLFLFRKAGPANMPI